MSFRFQCFRSIQCHLQIFSSESKRNGNISFVRIISYLVDIGWSYDLCTTCMYWIRYENADLDHEVVYYSIVYNIFYICIHFKMKPISEDKPCLYHSFFWIIFDSESQWIYEVKYAIEMEWALVRAGYISCSLRSCLKENCFILKCLK